MATRKSVWVLFLTLVISGCFIWSAIEARAEQTTDWAGYAAAWDAHDVDKLISFFTDDCIYEDLAFGSTVRGKEELKKYLIDTFAAFPDFKAEVKSSFESGNWYASEWVMSGTHKGDLPKLPATGKKFSVRGISVGELRDGKIKRNSDYYNLMTFLRQIGAIPSPPK